MSDQSTRNYEANPSSRPPSVLDILKCLLILPCIPWQLIRATVQTLQQPRSDEKVSFLTNFLMAMIRCSLSFVPLNVTRSFGDSSESILSSTRFSPCRASLYHKISRDGWAGYWICQGAPGKEIALASCDLVIYYIHGGGYSTGTPGTSLATLLRIAELAAERGTSVAIFGLDYSWIPDAIYPVQENQALEGYRFLLDEGISPAKLAILADSAGGHLALCLLLKVYESQIPKPETGIFLIAPWIDLLCSRDGSYVRNKSKDFIVRGSLIKSAKDLIGDGPLRHQPEIIDFALPRPQGQSWVDILPTRVWVSVGGHEVFLDDNKMFVECLKADGVNVDFEVAPGRSHTWQLVLDTFSIRGYLATTDSVLPEGVMEGAKNITSALLASLSSS